ncbi:MAG: serine/threonine protein kinase [Leptolyngbya foveolarum]|uniref:non-specific serine/threonine protein kinase n=1 Tax=Leptolyngbya foveolarum TaxID=47253 RepID=A0A2W4USV7_9CYAN|nr:MAG: serine/threonine protein kinase [Leptolyngbya foveolarum]
MQSAISIGTLLQNRYRIVQLLGQGGFGRTYLAEDTGRFQERCAIKEFVPTQGEESFSNKATELFQREASVLYQIGHPQIPKFQATFEEEDRLFLVQDYVEGPTYHDVLTRRRQQNRTFSETEVRQFLQQLLPVLAHIHAKGIIHRDISPDNIILRQKDQLPVLIDFGVVKEVVTRMQMDGVASYATTVGKAGYAPSEQMQTGRAYPSSDLYALAVTAVVMLTGKEPQFLFDDVNFSWRWEEETRVSPELASVLNKALSYRPGDRFQSVSQMVQALQSNQTDFAPIEDKAGNRGRDLTGGMTGAVPSPNLPSSSSANQPVVPSPYNQSANQPPVSQMKTVAVGRVNPDYPNTGAGEPTVNRPTTVRQQGKTPRTSADRSAHSRVPMPSERSNNPSFLENPLAVGGLAIGLAALAGTLSYGVVKVRGPQGVPEPTITQLPPLGSEDPSPKPTPTQATPKPVQYDQPPLSLVPGVKKTVEGNMRGGDTVVYPLTAEAGQTLTVEQAEESVLLTVLGPNGEPVGRRASRVRSWQGVLEESGEYKIQMSPVKGVSSSNYSLDATLSILPETAAEPQEPTTGDGSNSTTPDGTNPRQPGAPVRPDTPAPPPARPSIQSERVNFPSGTSRILLANGVVPGEVRRYMVNAREGQIMTVRITDAQGPAGFDVLMPGGEMMADASGIVFWESYLPVGGDYSIDVSAAQAAQFTLEIAVSAQIPTE